MPGAGKDLAQIEGAGAAAGSQVVFSRTGRTAACFLYMLAKRGEQTSYALGFSIHFAKHEKEPWTEVRGHRRYPALSANRNNVGRATLR